MNAQVSRQELTEFHDACNPPKEITAATLVEAYHLAKGQMTIEMVADRLDAATARIGQGHFTITFSTNSSPYSAPVFLSHWFRDAGAKYEECHTVGRGKTVAEALEALDDYVGSFHRTNFTPEEVAATIGL